MPRPTINVQNSIAPEANGACSTPEISITSTPAAKRCNTESLEIITKKQNVEENSMAGGSNKNNLTKVAIVERPETRN